DMGWFMNPSAGSDRRFLYWARRWARNSVSRDALPGALDMLSRTDVRHVLPSIRIPTLILHRAKDAVIPVENSRYLAEKIPGSRLVELEGDDHIPFLGDWEGLLAEVQE